MKGMGEGGAVVPPAIANTAIASIGAEVNETPITPAASLLRSAKLASEAVARGTTAGCTRLCSVVCLRNLSPVGRVERKRNPPLHRYN
jgi:hypothetical protein